MRDEHRLLLQSLIARPTLTEDSLKQLVAKCCAICGVDEPASVTPFLRVCKEQLDARADMDIKRMADQRTGVVWYALVNNRLAAAQTDQIAQLCTQYSATELALFRRLVDEIVNDQTGEFSINSKKAIQLGRQLAADGKGVAMSGQSAEAAMKQFVDDLWLTYSRGEYFLTPRAIMELDLAGMIQVKEAQEDRAGGDDQDIVLDEDQEEDEPGL